MPPNPARAVTPYSLVPRFQNIDLTFTVLEEAFEERGWPTAGVKAARAAVTTDEDAVVFEALLGRLEDEDVGSIMMVMELCIRAVG